MKKSINLLFLVLVWIMTGCAATGLTASSHQTEVQLNNPNFQIVATNLSGEASTRALLGVSYGLGLTAAQVGLIPLDKERMLYKTAMQELWTAFEESHGTVVGRKLALVNLRFDSESLNLFFYTKVKVAVVADIIEFQ